MTLSIQKDFKSFVATHDLKVHKQQQKNIYEKRTSCHTAFISGGDHQNSYSARAKRSPKGS